VSRNKCASWLRPPKADTVVFTVLLGFGHFPVRSLLFKKNYATFITSDTVFFVFIVVENVKLYAPVSHLAYGVVEKR